MPYQGFHKGAKIKKMSSKLRMAEFFTTYRINHCQLSRTQSFGLIFILPLITSATNFHLWDLCPTPALTILVEPTKRAGLGRGLCCWGYETEATQTAGQRWANPEDQSRTLRRLGQYQWRVALLGPPLHPENHPNRTN